MTTKQLFQKNLPILLSYLKTENGSKFNHIFTTPNKEPKLKKKAEPEKGKKEEHYCISKRSVNIGLAQFYIQYNAPVPGKNNKPFYHAQSSYVRVETNYFNGKLSISSNKMVSLTKSDILIFGDKTELYVSEEHGWLSDQNYFEKKLVNTKYGPFFLNEYNVLKLMKDRKIKYLYLDDDSKVCAFTGNLYDDQDQSREYFDYFDYSKEVEQLNKLFVPSDPKTAAAVFYCPHSYRYTDRISDIVSLSKNISKTFKFSEYKVNKKLRYAKKTSILKGVAIPAKFDVKPDIEAQLKNNLEFDFSCIVDHKYVIYVSDFPDYDVIDNKRMLKTENMKEYQKEYQKKNKDELNNYRKVSIFLKRHNNEMSPSWNEEEIALANAILDKWASKKQASKKQE